VAVRWSLVMLCFGWCCGALGEPISAGNVRGVGKFVGICDESIEIRMIDEMR